jgi:hypothetical protein
MGDYRIKNVYAVDGSGAPWYKADVTVSDPLKKYNPRIQGISEE